MKAKWNMDYVPSTAPTPSSESAASAAAVHAAHAKAASPELAESVARGYEAKDVGLRGVAIFLVILAAVVVVTFAFIYFLMFGLIGFMHSEEPKASPVTIVNSPIPQPLQPSVDHDTNDRDDMLQMRIETQNVLEHSGTTTTGRKYISITDAMNEVLSKLPTRPPA